VNEPEAAVWMGRLVELSRNEGALPDPALIWWKARLLEKQAAQARVVRVRSRSRNGCRWWWRWSRRSFFARSNWPGIKGVLEPAGFTLWVAGAGASF
jgi:hypothetical protein